MKNAYDKAAARKRKLVFVFGALVIFCLGTAFFFAMRGVGEKPTEYRMPRFRPWGNDWREQDTDILPKQPAPKNAN